MPEIIRSRPTASAIVVALFGLFFLVGGIWLVVLGGSWYYLIAGIALLATGALLWRGDGLALWLYALLLLGTLLWAVAEVGLHGWQLEPRLLLPILLGIYLLMPWVLRKLQWRGGHWALGAVVVVSVIVGIVGFSLPRGINGEIERAPVASLAHASAVADGDWLFYGRTPRGDRFSPLTQITPANVDKLQLAWQAHTGDNAQPGENKAGGTGPEFNFEDTPLEVNGTLYVCTGHSWVIAYDAVTGKRKWKFNPHANTKPDEYLACRGVAYYQAPAGTQTDCPRRIIAPVLDARMVALNADTGKPCEDFGTHGFISMTKYLGRVPPGFHFISSAPLVLDDRLITGGWIHDNQAEDEPSGAVRAFDPLSGQLVWAWDIGRTNPVVHPGDVGKQLTRGTPNAWGTYTADPELGLVYLPLGNATPDYFGGERRSFDEKYSSSTVALDIRTGAPRWVFQNVHHDLWDFDVPVGPSLVDLPGPGGSTIPALVQTTKRGQLFMLNRVTGKPIAKVEEKPVPQGAVPSDWTSRTQPFSTGMPSLTPKDLTESQLWGATPFDQLMCHIEFKSDYYKGHFTPPQLKNTIVYPAYDGVIDWMGASIDPYRKVLIANANYIPFIVSLQPRGSAVAAGKVKPWNRQGKEPKTRDDLAPMYGTPYVGKVEPWLNPLGVPCNPPPWGTLTAINLVTRQIVWQHPLGTTRDTGPFGTHTNLPLPTGIFNIGGNLITRGGLVFIGATADNYLRAIDETTGEVVWKTRLPAGGQATPMSYAVDGRQYVAIAAGGHGGLDTTSGDDVMVYALPSKGATASR